MEKFKICSLYLYNLHFGSPKSHWHFLDGDPMVVNVHDGHSRDFSDATPQVAITCRHDVASRRTTINEAVVSIGSLMLTGQALYPRVTQNSKLRTDWKQGRESRKQNFNKTLVADKSMGTDFTGK